MRRPVRHHLGKSVSCSASASRRVCGRWVRTEPRGHLLRTHACELRQTHCLPCVRQAGRCYLSNDWASALCSRSFGAGCLFMAQCSPSRRSSERRLCSGCGLSLRRTEPPEAAVQSPRIELSRGQKRSDFTDLGRPTSNGGARWSAGVVDREHEWRLTQDRRTRPRRSALAAKQSSVWADRTLAVRGRSRR